MEEHNRHNRLAQACPLYTHTDWLTYNLRGTQRQISENIFSEDDLRSRIFGTFVACLPLLRFSNI